MENTNTTDLLPEKEKNTEKGEKQYSLQDVVFAWLSYFFSYLFCRVFPVFENTLGGFAFVLLIFAATFTIIKLKKTKIPPMALAAGISAIAVSPALILTNSAFMIFLAYAYIIASYCYFVYAALGNCIENGISDFIFMDYIKALFIMPFLSITKIFKAIAYGKAKNTMKHFLRVLAGLAIAAIPTIIIFCLLSYDGEFVSIIENIFDFDMATVFSHIGSLILAIPLGMYVFGLFESSSEKLMGEALTAKDCNKGFETIRIMPRLTALTAVLPILFIYVVYFISQWKYYVSGFTGVLPEDLSYAEYAREGFFQLCAVSFINLLVIIAIVLFIKRKDGKTSPLLKILTTVFCIFTLVLISTAISKLVMYIDTYGLTQKRVYAMWLMVLIAVVFIIVAAGRFATRIKTVWVSLLACVVLFTALALSNVNGVIAEYNVDRYLDGTLDTVDISAMNRLGDAAIPAMVHLAEELDGRKADGKAIPEEMYTMLKDSLESTASYIQQYENSIYSFNVPTYRARIALTEYGLIEK